MKISIDRINPSEQQTLANLVKMYCYEWSQYNLMDVDAQGVYPFEPYVHFYFEKPRRYAYFARVEGVLAGFALIDDDFAVSKDSDYSMGEFFVLHKYRRAGVGGCMARTLFDQYPGQWEVGYHPHNTISEKFWLRTVDDYTGGDFTFVKECQGLHYHDGSYGNVFVFDSRNRAARGE